MWTYKATAAGYMFYFNGEPQGGAGTLDGKYSGRYAGQQTASYSAYCKRECERRNRDGIKLYDWNQLTDRRQGYAWFGQEPAKALAAYDTWARQHH